MFKLRDRKKYIILIQNWRKLFTDHWREGTEEKESSMWLGPKLHKRNPKPIVIWWDLGIWSIYTMFGKIWAHSLHVSSPSSHSLHVRTAVYAHTDSFMGNRHWSNSQLYELKKYSSSAFALQKSENILLELQVPYSKKTIVLLSDTSVINSLPTIDWTRCVMQTNIAMPTAKISQTVGEKLPFLRNWTGFVYSFELHLIFATDKYSK